VSEYRVLVTRTRFELPSEKCIRYAFRKATPSPTSSRTGQESIRGNWHRITSSFPESYVATLGLHANPQTSELGVAVESHLLLAEREKCFLLTSPFIEPAHYTQSPGVLLMLYQLLQC
jgi:hypothetical protein